MRTSYVFENGTWWYVGPTKKQTADSYERKNRTRMYVNGKYIPKSHPMHKPGYYATFEEAWNHKELDAQRAGHVYAVRNPAWPHWVKIGMAVDATDRLKAYQTSSPYRDYQLLTFIETTDKRKAEALAHRLCSRVCDERNGEWFKMPQDVAVVIIQGLKEVLGLPEEHPQSAEQLCIGGTL